MVRATVEPRPYLKLTAEIGLLMPDRPGRDIIVSGSKGLAQWSLCQAGMLYDTLFALILAGRYKDAATFQATTERLNREAARKAEAGLGASVITVPEIHKATLAGDIKRMEELLREGADVNAVTDFGLTLLHSAVANGSLPPANFLLANGADPGRSSPDRSSPMHYAAAKGRDRIIEAFLDHKVDINVTDADGATPLHHAAASGHLSTVELLVDRGADVNVATAGGLTALAVAEQEGHHEIADMLRRHGGAV